MNSIRASESNTLPRIIAEQLRRRYTGRLSAITTINELAHEYAVSPRTISRVLEILRGENMVWSHRGKGIRIGPYSMVPRHTVPLGPSACRLVDRIAGKIESGIFRTGTALPKLEYFTVSYAVSSNTVIAALRRLRQRSLVHKRGKQWIAGPREARGRKGTGTHGRTSPVVMLLMSNLQLWYRISKHQHFAFRFFEAFVNELQRNGIHVQLGVLGGTAPDMIHRGPEGISAHIRSCGSWLVGSLCYFQSISEISRSWFRVLGETRKPYIFFDPHLYEEELFSGNGGDFLFGKHFHRFYLNEPAGVGLAFETLQRLGHRKIGVIRHGVPFSRRRINLLRRASRAYGDSEIIEEERDPGDVLITDNFLSPSRFPGRWLSSRNMADYLERFDRCGPDDSRIIHRHRSRRALLVRHSPTIQRLLEHKVTAVVAPNDTFARDYFLWLNFAGVRVPEDVSLISFDNQNENMVFSLSSIDFGFDNLGYLAAHRLIGDITVRTDDRRGSLGSRPYLIDRGSLGRPVR